MLAVCAMLDMTAAAAMRLVGAHMSLHKAVCKLGFVATAILGGVVTDGFCIPPEQSDEVEGGPGAGQETGTVLPVLSLSCGDCCMVATLDLMPASHAV